ncbi:MAG: hypothetical protein ISR77_13540 [Pirellulaceae bacterium]|nr:hypothetical protein [Pirellulaceae bacterium]
MNAIIPPFCLVLSLLLLIGAFAVLAVESPQPGIELHRARVEDDEQYRDLLEQQLDRRRLQRKVLIGSLFGMAVIMAVAGFVAMRPPAPN